MTRRGPYVPDPEREARLPQYVRAELESLRRRAIELERIAEEARLATSPDESDTILPRFSVLKEHPIGLGRGTRVRFLPFGPGPDELRRFVDVRVMEDWEYVEVMGGMPLTIEAQAANVLRVRFQGV